MEILKRNLDVGQIVWYFPEPSLSEDGLDFHNKKVTMQELKFDGFQESRGAKAAVFNRVDGGRTKRFYDSIKGILYHTEDEAKVAFENKVVVLKKKVLKNSIKMIARLESNIAILETEV